MTYDSTLFNPTQLTLEIPSTVQAHAWQQSRLFATPNSQWNAYLNQLCLNTLLPWLRDEHAPQAQPHPATASLWSFWELVTGTAIATPQTRMVWIPSEAIDVEELRIPQEWVDIPNWVADYYWLVQVNPDDDWVRVAGFTTHQQLKTLGRYDWSDRTYTLDSTDLITDLNVLWVSQQVASSEPTQAAIAPLPLLESAQAQSLIQRLSSPTLLTPRLSIPFERWGALMQHGGWRQRLAQGRRGLPEQPSVLQWLQTGLSTLAQQLGWETLTLQPSGEGARGEGEDETVVGLARPLAIAGQTYELRVLPREPQVWRIELRSTTPGGRIPGGFRLRVLTEDLQPFTNNEDTATDAVEQLYVDVALSPGEGIVWEVEPIPDGYDREILQF